MLLLKPLLPIIYVLFGRSFGVRMENKVFLYGEVALANIVCF